MGARAPPAKLCQARVASSSGCSRTRAGRSGGAGRFIPATVGAPEHRPCSGSRGRAGRAGARAFAPSAERRRPGRDRLRCAAPLRSARRHRGPGRRQRALGRAPAPSAAPAPRRAHTHRPEERMHSRSSRATQAQPGGLFASIFAPPEAESSSGLAARSLAGTASGRLAGKFPPLPWHPALVAGADSRCTPQGAQHPLPHRSRVHPWLSSPPFPPDRASLAPMKYSRFRIELGLKTTHPG